MSGFVHDLKAGTTTISEITRVRAEISADRFFGCFAYATQSGFRSFELSVKDTFWASTESRWLLGIDYGRTDPRAMREIAKQANSEVRIFDGQYVVDQEAFAPRRDFHAKVALLENAVSGAKGLVLGSGNFSYNGLKRSVEAGAAFVAATKTGKECKIEPVSTAFESLWKTACPLDEIIDGYEAQIAALAGLRDGKRASKSQKQPKGFWIEAGYVTKNRGDNQPGNQIFAPSGFRRFFGLDKVKAGSTLIGTIAFKTDMGPTVTKNYRENDNHMEKLTLPMPEQHGFGVYDGKVLVFEAKGKGFHLTVIELSDFELVYGHRVANLKIMSGGRRFGELV